MKGKFFNKILLIYSAIVISAIAFVAYIAILNLRITFENETTRRNETMLHDVIEQLQRQRNFATTLLQQIYQNREMHAEILYLLEYGYPRLIEYKLERYCSSAANSWNGFESYLKSCLAEDRDLLRIGIVSRKRTEIYSFSNHNRIVYPGNKAYSKLVSEIADHPERTVIIPAQDLKQAEIANNEPAYTFAFPIRDNFSAEIKGIITFDYSIHGLARFRSKYTLDFKGAICGFNRQERLIFDLSQMVSGKSNVYFANRHHQYRTIEVNAEADVGIITRALIPIRQFYAPVQKVTRVIICLSLVCIIATIYVTYIVLRKFSQRVDCVIEYMKKTEQGNFAVRIPMGNEADEIGEIALSFNRMCAEISAYIQKVYLAQINEKNAQLKALQAQINPHFLYNTLEAIRMKAVTQGSAEVGEMIYLLAALLRSSVKAQTFVAIRDELKYSQMYCELFNLKYQGRLNVQFKVNPAVLPYGIAKHVLQPIIENYFVHGIDFTKEENELMIGIEQNPNTISFIVRDNGSGIGREKLESIQTALKSTADSRQIGLGLANVNQRLHFFYGPEYGLSIESEAGKGTQVEFTIPIKSLEDLETNVQGHVC